MQISRLYENCERLFITHSFYLLLACIAPGFSSLIISGALKLNVFLLNLPVEIPRTLRAARLIMRAFFYLRV